VKQQDSVAQHWNTSGIEEVADEKSKRKDWNKQELGDCSSTSPYKAET
jgi:hypothetical protein